MHVFQNNWSKITPQDARRLFMHNFPSVKVLPMELLPRLQQMQRATIELIEERTESTVYRIRETNSVFQLPPNKNDRVTQSYGLKEPAFVLAPDNTLLRLKEPKFEAKYTDAGEILEVSWKGEEPNQTKVIATLKNAKGFLRSFVKNKNKKHGSY